jgi:hypothetical protein
MGKLAEKDNYVAVFKGSIVLLTLALIALSQLSTISSIEKDALKSKFATEMELGVLIEDFENYKCDVKTKAYVDCKLSKTQLSTVDSFAKIILQVYRFAIYLGGILLSLSICGYFQSTRNEFNRTET